MTLNYLILQKHCEIAIASVVLQKHCEIAIASVVLQLQELGIMINDESYRRYDYGR